MPHVVALCQNGGFRFVMGVPQVPSSMEKIMFVLDFAWYINHPASDNFGVPPWLLGKPHDYKVPKWEKSTEILVGGIPTPLKNVSQLGLLFPIYGKIKVIPLKWMIWGYPHFRKPPNLRINDVVCHEAEKSRGSFPTVSGKSCHPVMFQSPIRICRIHNIHSLVYPLVMTVTVCDIEHGHWNTEFSQ